ncbi:MAG: GNAT family N-acetyltransferase, partial [Treponema sp.]|nr:GNAT family N-acetyltransferase [Treponema sp.]
PGPLSFRSIAETGENAFVKMVELVTAGSFGGQQVSEAMRFGNSVAAREYIDSLKEIDFNPHWWLIGFDQGKPIGLVLPQRFSDSEGTINYVGVLPNARGQGYSLHLLAEGTRILSKSGITKIYADIDSSSKPLAASLELLGYSFDTEEAVLTKSF